jgi:hypothetical protein
MLNCFTVENCTHYDYAAVGHRKEKYRVIFPLHVVYDLRLDLQGRWVVKPDVLHQHCVRVQDRFCQTRTQESRRCSLKLLARTAHILWASNIQPAILLQKTNWKVPGCRPEPCQQV